MRKTKVLIVILIALAIIISGTKYVLADSYDVSLAASAPKVAAGQTAIVTVSLTDIDSSNGIYGLEGKLDYDTELFEEIKSDGAGKTDKITSDWGDVTYNSETKEFSVSTTSPAKTTQAIMQIKFTVKEGAKLGNAVIMLSDLKATNNSDELDASPVTVSLAIVNANEATGTIPQITTTPSPAVTPTSIIPGVQTSATPTATPNASNLPQTGIEDSPMPIVFGVLIIALISYIAYRKYRDI